MYKTTTPTTQIAMTSAASPATTPTPAGALSDRAARSAAHAKAEADGDSGRKRRRLVVRVGLVVVLIILMLFTLNRCGFLHFPQDEKPSEIVAGDLFPGEGDAKDGHLPDMTEEETLKQMQRAVDASYFSFKINARPVFKDGRAEGTVGIENPAYNTYPMVVQIFLDDTGELVYDSAGILPDQHIDTDTLDVSLDAGVYEATAWMNAYDPDTDQWLGQQAAALVISVEE